MNHDELQRVVALARIVLQVDGIPGREPYATSHLVSTEDLHASVIVPTTPDAPWRIELSEADTDLIAGEGATGDAALADLRAKVEAVADVVTQAIGEARERIRHAPAAARAKRPSPTGTTTPARVATADEITAALRASGGNVARAAKMLGCAGRSVRRWIDQNPSLMPDGMTLRRRGRPSRGANDHAEKAVA